MPNRNTTRRSRRPNRRSRRNVQNTNSVRYPLKIQSFINTLPAMSSTSRILSTSVLTANEFSPLNARTCQLRSVRIYFNPIYNAAIAAQPIEAQLFWDNQLGNRIAMTNSIPLSQSNKTILSYRLPFNYDEYRLFNDTNPLLTVVLFNPFSASALTVPISFNVELNFAISRDVPNTI
jgi:hypothetical protein